MSVLLAAGEGDGCGEASGWAVRGWVAMEDRGLVERCVLAGWNAALAVMFAVLLYDVDEVVHRSPCPKTALLLDRLP